MAYTISTGWPCSCRLVCVLCQPFDHLVIWGCQSVSFNEQGCQQHGPCGVERRRPPMQKLKPVPEKGVAMRMPKIALNLLPETEGPSSGEAELTRSSSGSCAAVSSAKGVPSVAAVGDDACVWCPLAAICARSSRKLPIKAGTPLTI